MGSAIPLSSSSLGLSLQVEVSKAKCCFNPQRNANKSVSFSSGSDSVLVPGDMKLKSSRVNGTVILLPNKNIFIDKETNRQTIADYWSELTGRHSILICSIVSAWESINFSDMYEKGKPLLVAKVHVLNDGFERISEKEGLLEEVARKIGKASEVIRKIHKNQSVVKHKGTEEKMKLLIPYLKEIGLVKETLEQLATKLRSIIDFEDAYLHKSRIEGISPKGLVQLSEEEAAKLWLLTSNISQLCEKKFPGQSYVEVIKHKWNEVFSLDNSEDAMDVDNVYRTQEL